MSDANCHRCNAPIVNALVEPGSHMASFDATPRRAWRVLQVTASHKAAVAVEVSDIHECKRDGKNADRE